MNDRDALLNAIGEHPEEDTPRLMYADWLEENGEPKRADFVRNQVELSRIGLNGSNRGPLVMTNRGYLTDFVPYWRSLLPRIGGIAWGDFTRGLIEEVQAEDDSTVAAHAATIFAVPGVHVLRLARLRDPRALAERPELARVRTLRLVGALASGSALRVLLASPHLARLRVLEMDRNGADNAVAADIADGRFPDLTELWLGWNAVGDSGALALANSPHLANLRVLDLTGNLTLTDHAARNALRKRFGKALKL